MNRADVGIGVLGGLVVAVGLAVAGWFVGQGVVNARVGDRAVTVRGLSEREAKADLAVLPLRFAATGEVLSDVQAQVDRSTDTVRRFLVTQGFKPGEVDVGRLTVVDQRSKEYQNGAATGPRFILSQTVEVRTTEVERVRETTRRLGELVRQDVVLQDFQGPAYIFTRLNDVRPAMIREATASARSGAEQFARDSGAALAGIQDATQGSFEILPRDQTSEGRTSRDRSGSASAW